MPGIGVSIAQSEEKFVMLTLTRLRTRLRAVVAVVATCWLLASNIGAAEPGLALANAEVGDQKTGSVLVYPLFVSSASSPQSTNTQISITNTNATQTAVIHLFFVDGSSGANNDYFLFLTPSQTARFAASDIEPGVRGYLLAVVTNFTGCPENFNYLAGEAYVKLGTGQTANLPATAIAALTPNPAGCSSGNTTAVLNFNGVNYNLLPRTLAATKLRSPADGNASVLAVMRLGGNLATGPAVALGTVAGELIDDLGNGVSYTHTEAGPQLFMPLSDAFPSTTPVLSTVLPSGRTGWLTLAGNTNAGLFGVLLNFNPSLTAQPAAYRSGHNLHHLTLATAVSLTIPVFPPQ